MKHMVVIAIICLWIVSSNFIMAGTVNSDVTLQKVFQSSSSSIKTARFSPDGKYFFTGGDYSTSILIWNTEKLTVYREIDFYKFNSLFPAENKPRSIVGVDFIPDSKSIYCGLNNGMSAIVLLDTLDFKIYDFKNNCGSDTFSAISNSGNILALGGSYFNIARNKLIKARSIADAGLVITRDDKYLLSGLFHYRSVEIADVDAERTKIWKPDYLFSTPNVSSIDVAPDNDTIAAGLNNGDIRLYSIRKGKETGNLFQGGWRVKISFSPDGKMLLSFSDNISVKLWDVASQRRKRTWKTDNRVSSMKWLPGVPWVAFGTDRGELIIESAEKGETIYKGKVMERRISDIDYLPTRHLLLLCDSWGTVAAFEIR